MTRSAPERIVAQGTGVNVQGPDGYCVDPVGSTASDGAAFVLLGNCAAISNSPRAPQPALRAILTASVGEESPGPGVAASAVDLDEFFRSERGRALLSQGDSGSDVEILDTFLADETFFVHARDRSDTDPDLSEERWRAVMDVRDRLVTLSVLGLSDAPISGEEGLELVTDFTRRVRAANTGDAPNPTSPALDATPQPTPPPVRVETTPRPARIAPAKPLGRVGILRRILG